MSDPRRNDLSQNQASTLDTTSDAYVDLMHDEGQEVEVDEFDNLGPQRACFACVTNLSNTSQAYFFCLNRYVLVDLASGPPFGMTIQGPALLPPLLADMLHDPDHALYSVSTQIHPPLINTPRRPTRHAPRSLTRTPTSESGPSASSAASNLNFEGENDDSRPRNYVAF